MAAALMPGRLEEQLDNNTNSVAENADRDASAADSARKGHHYGHVEVKHQAAAHFGDSYTTYNLIVADGSTTLARGRIEKLIDSRTVDAEALAGYLLDIDKTGTQQNVLPVGHLPQARKRSSGERAASGAENAESETLQSLAKRILDSARQGQDWCIRDEELEELADKFDSIMRHAKLLLFTLSSSSPQSAAHKELSADCMRWLNKACLHIDRAFTCIKATSQEDKNYNDIADQPLTRLKKAEKLLIDVKEAVNMAVQFDSQLRQLETAARNQVIMQKAYDDVQQYTKQNPHTANPSTEISKASAEQFSRSYDNTARTLHWRKAERKYRYRLQCPWPIRKSFDLVLGYGSGSINFGIQAYIIVPWDSHMGDTIENDDLVTFRDLVTENGSLRIQLEGSFSLLEAAFHHGSTALVQFLLDNCLQEDLNVQGETLGDLVCLRWLYIGNDLTNFTAATRCWKMIVDRFGDDMADLFPQVARKVSMKLVGEWTDWLPKWHRAATDGLLTLPLECRAFLLDKAHKPNQLAQLLSSHNELSALLDAYVALTTRIPPLLGNVASGSPNLWSEWSSVTLIFWQWLILQPLRQELDWQEKSPLSRILHTDMSPHCLHHLSRGPCCKMRRWLVYLHDLGLDLVEYGQLEACSLGRSATFNAGWLLNRRFALMVGPSPDDWKLYAAPMAIEYEMAATFWAWAERPASFAMPGQFVHEDEWDSSEEQHRPALVSSQDCEFADSQLKWFYFMKNRRKQYGANRIVHSHDDKSGRLIGG